MRYWINDLRCVNIRDINTVNELKTFVRYPNGTWAAKKEIDCQDDRVMSLIWSLIVLEETLADKYYEVVEYDDNHKPQKLKSLDYGTRNFVNPLSIYSNEKIVGDGANTLPMVFGEGGKSTDLEQLESDGWKFLSARDEGRFHDIYEQQQSERYYGEM